MPVTYKCPSCGAAMEFDSTFQMLSCHQCGNKIDVHVYEEKYGKQQEQKNQGQTYEDNAHQAYGQSRSESQGQAQGYAQSHTQNQTQDQTGNASENQRGHQEQVKIYHCQSCGAELVADQYTSATICSFCGNPSLVEDRLEGDFTPSVVIPFKLNKEQAVQAYKKWVKKGPLTPKTLSTAATIEKISGLYVPFWLYDYSGECKMNAAAQRVRTERRGDTEYIYTDHYHIYRDMVADFEKIPADASEKMPDDAMDKLEPFNYNELEPFSMPYLSGYLSERYNYTDKDMEERVRSRANEYITQLTRNTIKGYSTVSVLNNNINMQNTHNVYALFPVWMLNCRYQNKDFQFMLNGQTGKIVANRPISVGRAVAWGIGIFLITLVITMLGGLLL